MNEVIRRLGQMDPHFLMEEAETYICALCDMERKPCKIHTGTKCALMIREGTELEYLQYIDRKRRSNLYGWCISCGQELDAQTLAQNPLTELCITCKPHTRKITERES